MKCCTGICPINSIAWSVYACISHCDNNRNSNWNHIIPQESILNSFKWINWSKSHTNVRWCIGNSLSAPITNSVSKMFAILLTILPNWNVIYMSLELSFSAHLTDKWEFVRLMCYCQTGAKNMCIAVDMIKTSPPLSVCYESNVKYLYKYIYIYIQRFLLT